MDYNFTDRMRKVLALAKKESSRFHHPSVEPSHILLALLKERGGIASSILKELGVNVESVQQDVETLVRDEELHDFSDRGAFSLEVRRVLERAMVEARGMGSTHIGTEHLLLGLIEHGGRVAVVLENAGITASSVQQVIQSKFQGVAAGEQHNSGSHSDTNKKTGHRSPQQSRRTPALDAFTRDLTELAAMGKLDPVVGRASEVERVIEILLRKKKNNPVLVGEPGVGKTALVEGLAQMVVADLVPEGLKGVSVLSLDMGAVLAGTRLRGQFEERIHAILSEVAAAEDVVLFIDEIHTLIGAGGNQGSLDAANLLKPALARGELRCIGATTLDEYRKYIEKDGALERRFQVVHVEPASIEEALEILKGLKVSYEEFHGVVIPDEAIESAVRLSDRYINDRFLPDKAIDVLDEASARLRLRRRLESPEVKELYAQLEAVVEEKADAIRSQQFERAAELRDRERQLKGEIRRRKEEWESLVRLQRPVLEADDVAFVVSRWTGIPVQGVDEDEARRLALMESTLKQRVIGQDDAVSAVTRAIKRSRAGLRDPRRPIGSFIFAGPTGVGKTKLAQEIAKHLFGSRDALIRIDMSEYMEKHSVSGLIGAPPGYVGHDEAGRLTEAVRRRPYSVVLLDEIEKAHPDVFGLLLQILEDGRLTDNRGRVVSFKNTLIVMTSNLGSGSAKKQSVGFGHGVSTDAQAVAQNVKSELDRVFSPELLNRIDETIVFSPLQLSDAQKIVALFLEDVGTRVAEQGITLSFTEGAVRWLAQEGHDDKFGARPLRRAVERHVEDPLADLLLAGDVRSGDHIRIRLSGCSEGKLDFRKVESVEESSVA